MFEKKLYKQHRVEPIKGAGDTRRGTYIFEDLSEAFAWDILFASKERVKKLIASDPGKVYPTDFLNIEALQALCDRRTGNFVNPEFLEMLYSRLTQMGYDIVDECRKQGWSENFMKQQVNYYYDEAMWIIQRQIAEEADFYKRRGLLEQVEEDYKRRKEAYSFVDGSQERIQRAQRETSKNSFSSKYTYQPGCD